jgi:localization factor PodJL
VTAPGARPAPSKTPAPRVAAPLKPAAGPVTANRLVQRANTGDPAAQTILGLHYLEGAGGLHADSAKAAKWLGEAAEKGQPVAQYRYGTLLERGQGIAADPAKAMHWYRAAAIGGNLKAMHNLAVGYAQGSGGKKDMGEAARWFAKAAGLGLPDSQFNLAVLYERGEGVPKSMIDACKWYAIAAAEGDAESRQRLSVLETQLSAADRAAAQRAATGFHRATLDRGANLPPETSAPAD